MNLYRFQLVPESPWLTPWQADTLSGLLCWACARTVGSDTLRRSILEPALAGQPSFVLSDAFPGDWLPIPTSLRLSDWPANERKHVKRAHWLNRDTFMRAQRGEPLAADDMITDVGTCTYTQLRNTIGRTNNTTAHGGGLFPREESVLEKGTSYLTVYARVESEFLDTFQDLLEELSSFGFGADVSAGKGQFRLESRLESASRLDEARPKDNGCVILSTFQPGDADPTDGCWEAFTKYGRLGPDFGLENVFKRPLVMLRPGACFRTAVTPPWLGRAVPMRELLDFEVAAGLRSTGIDVCHLAFGLCLPMSST